jgi:hypothetical protein
MELSSIAASFAASRADATQQALAAEMLKMNLAAQASVVKLLEQAQEMLPSPANLAAGVGGNLDVSV